MPHQAGLPFNAEEFFAPLPGDVACHHGNKKSVTYIVIRAPLRDQLAQNRKVNGDQQDTEPRYRRPGYGPDFCRDLPG